MTPWMGTKIKQGNGLNEIGFLASWMPHEKLKAPSSKQMPEWACGPDVLAENDRQSTCF